MDRKEQLVKELNEYPIILTTAACAEIIGCSHRKAFCLQQEGKIKSFLLDPESGKKVYKTLKIDLIDYMLQTN